MTDETKLGAAQSPRHMDFFTSNVDAWGAAEWFDRLAKAVRGQDAAVVAKDDMAFETCKNVAASSAMCLVRDYEQQVRAALGTAGAVEAKPVRTYAAEELAKKYDWCPSCGRGWNLYAAPSAALDPAAAEADECVSCPYADMLWKWFRNEERIGTEAMRAEMIDGLSADDFKQMLDDHEAALCSVTSTDRVESSASLGYKAGLIKAAEIVGHIRQSEAGLFDEKHSGQRGCDRADALFDAYVAIRKELNPVSQTPRAGGNNV